MAAGSHAEKGIWALLVIAASMIKKETGVRENRNSGARAQIPKLKSPIIANHAIDKRIQTSPTRLERTVIMPALLDFLEG